MFNFFRKEKKCSICGITSEKNTIFGFDPSNRGEFPEFGKKEDLCINHLSQRWMLKLEKYNGFSICYLPLKGWNSYSYTALKNASGWGVTKDDIGRLDKAIDNYVKLGKCLRCSKKAKFALFNHIYGESTQEVPKLLCEEHFVKEIIQEIVSKNLSIDEINIPFEDKGIYMHGEY